jgi:hypothetical protein
MMRTWDKSILPRLRESFAAGGASFSSRRAITEANALSDMSGQLAAQLAQLQYQNQGLAASLSESAAQRQLSAAALGQQMRLSPLEAALGFTNGSQMMAYTPQQSPWLGVAATGAGMLAGSFLGPIGAAAGGAAANMLFPKPSPVSASLMNGGGMISMR